MVCELSELLMDVLGVTDVGASFPRRVTYHPTRHSLRMLLCAGANSCLMHIGGGLGRLRTGVGTMRLAEIHASTTGDPA